MGTAVRLSYPSAIQQTAKLRDGSVGRNSGLDARETFSSVDTTAPIESQAMPSPIHRSEISEGGEPGGLQHAASANHGPLFAKLISEIHRARSLEQKQRDLRAEVQTALEMNRTLHKELKQNIQRLHDQRARHKEIVGKLRGKPLS